MDRTLNNAAPRARAISLLKKWISDGTLQKDEPLPAERELCERMEVSRPTCRRAILALQKEGLIVSVGPKTRVVAGPSRAASLLNSTIVIFTPYPRSFPGHTLEGWADSISAGALHGVGAHSLHALQFHPDQLQADILEQFAFTRPYGVVIPELWRNRAPSQELLGFFAQHGIPLTAYGDSPELADFDRVISDHETGTYEITSWLIKSGRRKILPFWNLSEDSQQYWLQARRRGYERAMRDAGLEPLPTISFNEYPQHPGRHDSELFNIIAHHYAGYLAPILLKMDFDAIELTSDGYAPAVTAALKMLGKRVHDDIAVAAYDNYWSETPESTFEPTPPLATVDKNNVKLGQELVNLLAARVEGKLPAEPQRRIVQQTLVTDVK